MNKTLERSEWISAYWYDRMALSGRESLLFGSNVKEQCLRAVRRSLSEGAYFGLFSEFPLFGKPFLDLSVYDSGGNGGFIEGNGFGYAPLFSYCKDVGMDRIGLEYDLSSGGENNPHAVIFPPHGKDDEEYIKCCLSLMGLDNRVRSIWNYISKAPWEFKYFGGYFDDKDRPVRIVFRIGQRELSLIRSDLTRFLLELSDFGFEGGELPGFQLLSQNAETLEISFDVNPDGQLNTSFGCVRGMTRHGNDFLPTRFLQSTNAAFFFSLEEAGLIDGRWREVVETAFASLLTMPDGEKIFAKHAIHSVKFKWKDGISIIPKIYTEFVCGNYESSFFLDGIGRNL